MVADGRMLEVYCYLVCVVSAAESLALNAR